jgi:hypothetical protein
MPGRMAECCKTKPYVVPDDRLPAGSTLGAPKVMMVVKATGAVEQIYATDAGVAPFGCLEKIAPPPDIGEKFSC